MGTILDDKQIKGVDMVIKAICKKYKFIKGWELYPKHEDYNSVIFIHIFMDYQEFANTYNYYIQPINWRRSASTPAPYLGRNKEDYDKPYSLKDKTVYEEVKEIKEDIENTIQELYIKLPNEFISTFSTDEYPDKSHPRTIMITEFIDTDDTLSSPNF
jgi:hypothetical protein